ncbi:MAG: hypothetical protein KDC38_20990 [Planctomycetes bacterium]|nr:hypothetical protein [Planctomycetota bacterium]
MISYGALVRAAQQGDCATSAFPISADQLEVAHRVFGDRARLATEEVRVVKDTKYYLRRTPLRFVPMSRTQATRANADVANARRILSPSQLDLLEFIEKHPDAGWDDVVDKDPRKVWDSVESKRRAVQKP